MRYNIADLYDGWFNKDKSIMNNIVTICGWVEYKRFASDILFLFTIRDGTHFKNIQVICEAKNFKDSIEFINLSKVQKGASISINGKLIRSPIKGVEFEFIASSGEIIANTDSNYPLEKSKLNNEYLRDFPHLRNRTKVQQTINLIRNTVIFEIHQFFNKLNFVYVQTPILTNVDYGDKTYKIKSILNCGNSLCASNAFHLESFITSNEKVYTLGPVFRGNKEHNERSLNEFWMISSEMAFIDFDELLKSMELFVKYIFSKVLNKNKEALDFFKLINTLSSYSKINDSFLRKRYDECHKFIKKEIDCGNIMINKKSPTKRLENGILILSKNPEFGEEFDIDILNYLAEEFGNKPFFITNYPKLNKSFNIKEDEIEICYSLNAKLIVPEFGDIMSGALKEEKVEKLKKSMFEKNIQEKYFNWYLESQKYGTVSHAGFSAGLERLLMVLTGIKNIREIVPYPRSDNNCFA